MPLTDKQMESIKAEAERLYRITGSDYLFSSLRDAKNEAAQRAYITCATKYLEQQEGLIRDAWEVGCKAMLKDMATGFADNANKVDLQSDKDVFRAISETIQNFPLPSPETFIKAKQNKTI